MENSSKSWEMLAVTETGNNKGTGMRTLLTLNGDMQRTKVNPFQCYGCGEMVHFKRDCPIKPPKRGRMQGLSEDKKPRSKPTNRKFYCAMHKDGETKTLLVTQLCPAKEANFL